MIKFNIDGLKNLQKMLKKTSGGDAPVARVGVLGDNAQRKDKDGQTNADIGIVHEFGRKSGKVKIPQRSFLKFPLTTRLEKNLKKKKSLTKKAFEQSVKDGKLEEFVGKVGLVGEETVHEAFSTSGWGQWKPNAPLTRRLKKSAKPLIDTRQLERSITSDVKKRSEV